MIGINIRNTILEPYADLIVDGNKTIETRESQSLWPYIGKRVCIISTGRGQAMLIGYVDIVGFKIYKNEAQFNADRDKHCVPHNSKYDISRSKNGYKFGYVMSNPERINPVPVYNKGIVARTINV